jgi:hypothetical protein
MYHHVKKLMYTVKVDTDNSKPRDSVELLCFYEVPLSVTSLAARSAESTQVEGAQNCDSLGGFDL